MLDDGSQGAETVSSKEEARNLVARKRLGVTQGAWQGLQRGRLPFSWWAEQWWEISGRRSGPQSHLACHYRVACGSMRPWFVKAIKQDRPG